MQTKDIPTIGPANSPIFILGDAPSKEDQYQLKPFVGSAGRMLDQILTASGIYRTDCRINHTARCQPPGGKTEFFFEDKEKTIPKWMMTKWINDLKQELEASRPNVVIALGNTALWALTGEHKITQFRGTVLESTLVPGLKVLPTFHPSYLMNAPKDIFTAIIDLKKALKHSAFPEIPQDNRTLIPDAKLDEFLAYCEEFQSNPEWDKLSYDIETDARGCHIHRVGIGHSPDFAMSISICNGQYARFSTEEEHRLWITLAKLLTSKKLIVQNGSFDVGVSTHHLGIHCVRNLWMDTHIAAHVVIPETPRSLGYLTSIFLDVPAWKHTSKDNPGLYNAADVANTFGVAMKLEQEIKLLGLENIFQMEMSQIEPAVLLQLQGLQVHEDTRQKLACLSMEEMDDIEEGLEKVFGKKVKFSSSQQLSKLLYQDLNLPVQYKRRKSVTEAKKVTTNAEALTKLDRTCDNPALKLIMRWKKLHKLVTGFLDIDISPEGRVHTSYNITGSTTRKEEKRIIVDSEESHRSFGRWSSSSSIILPYGSGNLQNIPKIARTIFRAPEGKVILSADYKQAEAVVVAYLINDVPLKQMFQKSFGKSKAECDANHWDVHKITASMMFGVDVSEITKDQRNVGKTLRHALSYSAGPGVVATKLNCPVADAKRYFQIYHNAVPQLHIWQQALVRELQQTRVLCNLLGRRHKFLDRWDDSLFRSAYSFVPQSTVGDLLNMSLVDLYHKHSSWLDLILQLHDAVYVLVDKDRVEEGMAAMRECMIRPLTTKHGETFCIDVDFSVGSSWGELKEI